MREKIEAVLGYTAALSVFVLFPDVATAGISCLLAMGVSLAYKAKKQNEEY